MRTSDLVKVMNAGVKVLTARSTHPIGRGKDKHEIYVLTPGKGTKGNPSWAKYEGPFPSRTARDRRLKELRESPMIIEDGGLRYGGGDGSSE